MKVIYEMPLPNTIFTWRDWNISLEIRSKDRKPNPSTPIQHGTGTQAREIGQGKELNPSKWCELVGRNSAGFAKTQIEHIK
jgi:hypothetical protein